MDKKNEDEFETAVELMTKFTEENNCRLSVRRAKSSRALTCTLPNNYTVFIIIHKNSDGSQWGLLELSILKNMKMVLNKLGIEGQEKDYAGSLSASNIMVYADMVKDL